MPVGLPHTNQLIHSVETPSHAFSSDTGLLSFLLNYVVSRPGWLLLP